MKLVLTFALLLVASIATSTLAVVCGAGPILLFLMNVLVGAILGLTLS